MVLDAQVAQVRIFYMEKRRDKAGHSDENRLPLIVS
jgi:hypothetical protein